MPGRRDFVSAASLGAALVQLFTPAWRIRPPV
jgi:hypothetical protein